MSLKACRECTREVSTEAATCPHCGAAAPTRERSAKWVPCPRCGSAKTRRANQFVLVGTALFAGAGCLLWVPVVGWVIAAAMLVLAVILWLAALVAHPGQASFQCTACKQWFTVPKRELTART